MRTPAVIIPQPNWLQLVGKLMRQLLLAAGNSEALHHPAKVEGKVGVPDSTLGAAAPQLKGAGRHLPLNQARGPRFPLNTRRRERRRQLPDKTWTPT